MIPYGTSSVKLAGLDLLAGASVGQVDFVLSDMTGWDGKPAPTGSVTQKPRANGGWAGDSYLGSRHVAFSGVMSTTNAAALQTAIDAFNAAVATSDVELEVTVLGATRRVMVRSEDEVIVDRLSPWQAEWSAQVVALDSRKFGEALTGSTGLPSSTGGLTVPVVIAPPGDDPDGAPVLTLDEQVVSGQIALSNPGTASGPVMARIDGPCKGPKITHVSTGRALVFSSALSLAADEFLIVDMEKHTAMLNDLMSRSGWIDRRGWSQFDPSQNVWSFSSTGADEGGKLTITATPAWQ